MVGYLPEHEHDEQKRQLTPSIPPFAGRMGGNQDFVVDRNDPRNEKVLERVPDAASCMTMQEVFDLRGFLSADLWKFALLECVGMELPVLFIHSILYLGGFAPYR